MSELCFTSGRDRRFTKSERVVTTADAVAEVEGGRWLMFDYGGNRTPKPQHPGFVISMTIRTLALFVRSGRVFKVVDRKASEAK